MPEPHNLPLPPTRLIGRQRELAALKQQSLTARLVTLIGPGGCGKTRLALQLAHEIATEFSNGAVWCSLVSVADAAYLPQRLADELALPEQPGRSPLNTIIEALAGKRTLIVLDNCEHLLAACATAAQAILHACPNVMLLATSLQALGLPEERVHSMTPLATPADTHSFDTESLARLNEIEAVQLFVERAQQALPTFTLTAQNATPVAAICRQVDGLPLALELAAARVRMLAPAQIAQRLEDASHLLTRGPADDPRHQTLNATLEWSWELLDDSERALLRRLSVFAGAFTLEAAEAVCTVAANEPPVLDTLTDLADKSLIQVVTREAESETRYRLLELVRQHAREKLEAAGETLTVRGRHLEWYAEWAFRIASELIGPQQVMWLNRLEAEQDNFRAALGGVRVSRRTEPGLRLAWALWRFWLARNHLTEGRAWLEELLTLDEQTHSAPPPLRARALYAAAALSFRQSDRARAQTLAEAGLRLARDSGEGQTVGGCLNLLAILATERGELEHATALHTEALALQRAAGNPAGISTALINLGMIARQQGEFQRAHDLYEEALTLKRQIGEALQAALALNSLGEIAIFRGDDQSAAVRLEESEALFRELGYKPGLGQALNNLATLARNRGDGPRARRWMADSLKVLEEAGDPNRIAIGRLNLGDLARDDGDLTQAKAVYAETLAQCRAAHDQWGSALALHLLGLVAADEGDPARAQALHLESLTLYRSLGYRLGMVEALEALASVTRSRDEAQRATRWLGAVAAERAKISAPVLAAERARYERGLATLRAELGQATFDALWAEGRTLPLDRAMAEVLEPVATQSMPSEAAAPAVLRIFSLGPAHVLAGEREVTEWTYAKARELLYFLLTHPPQTKAHIGLALWPDASPAQLRNIFHRALHSLRDALGQPGWVLFENETYSFNRTRPFEYDAEVFEAGVTESQRAATTTPEQRQTVIARLETITQYYRGDFLNDLDVGEWALARREELRRLNLEALLRLGRLRFAEAQYAPAAQAFERVLVFDNYLELAHRELMRCRARQGEVGQAVRQYQSLRQLLRDELGALPAPETTTLYDRLRRGDDV